ncbi:hypothetical protein NUW58_g3149 [Xylaria curta]|uniref:Uncharacterized protein n=1 Tax=Xylaria curta TaxID=42375 RepID=A0ACC1PD84_9PEZI|nr:hypothetical protein NUW58_g3149 [Xylaria curta]
MSPTTSLLMKPPLNATNSWVISHARELIEYDRYQIEQWLDEVIDDGDDDEQAKSNTQNHTDKPADHSLSNCGHPAGELRDYDPDCIAFSLNDIVENLENAASETEARDPGDGTFLDGLGTSSSAYSTFCYQYDGLDSLEGEPLLDSYRNDLRSTTSGTSNRGPNDMTYSPVSDVHLFSPSSSLDAKLVPRLEIGWDIHTEKEVWNITLTHSTSKELSFSSKPSPSTSQTQFLTLAPASHMLKARCDRSPYTYTRPSTVTLPSVERCTSPVPSVRGSYHISPFPDLSPTSKRPGLRVSKSGITLAAPEVIRPVPQQAERLIVPCLSRNYFQTSPFQDQWLVDDIPVLTCEAIEGAKEEAGIEMMDLKSTGQEK